MDFAESAVRAIPDTEDFISNIGHMATEDEIMHLQKKEIRLEEKDFVDPTLVFEDNGELLLLTFNLSYPIIIFYSLLLLI